MGAPVPGDVGDTYTHSRAGGDEARRRARGRRGRARLGLPPIAGFGIWAHLPRARVGDQVEGGPGAVLRLGRAGHRGGPAAGRGPCGAGPGPRGGGSGGTAPHREFGGLGKHIGGLGAVRHVSGGRYLGSAGSGGAQWLRIDDKEPVYGSYDCRSGHQVAGASSHPLLTRETCRSRSASTGRCLCRARGIQSTSKILKALFVLRMRPCCGRGGGGAGARRARRARILLRGRPGPAYASWGRGCGEPYAPACTGIGGTGPRQERIRGTLNMGAHLEGSIVRCEQACQGQRFPC
jgi:hypothetical protein